MLSDEDVHIRAAAPGDIAAIARIYVDAGKKAAHRVLLPAGGLHHRFDRCAGG
jgi:hypothetical protein